MHLEAIRFASEGYTILLIGHEGHDEVVGTMGEAPASIRLVQDEAEVAALDLPADAKVAYLTQTTLSVDDAEVIIAALRKRFPHIVGPVEGRHLLRDAEPPGSGARNWCREAESCWCSAAEQLEQLGLAELGGQTYGKTGAPDRRRRARSRRMVSTGRDGAGHGRGERAGRGGAGMRRRICEAAIRRDGREVERCARSM